MKDFKQIKLSNDVVLPSLGYGSAIVLRYMYNNCSFKTSAKYWIRNIIKDRRQFKKDKSLPKIIEKAMELNCTLFDTSRAYAGSEYVLGKILKKYNRDKYFICTKLCNSDQKEGNVRAALEKSLRQLNLEYVDLYLIHWPQTGTWLKCWKQMEEIYKEGLCKAIGVCNCNIHHLEELKQVAEIMPMVNQFECHPLFTQYELRQYCKENYIQVMAYTPTARMDERLRNTVLMDLSRKYKKSLAQIVIRWHIQNGNIPIVNTSNQEHLRENIDVFNFRLTQEEMNLIDGININSRLRYDPDNCDFSKL
ncbi:aldo/keto reductase [Clostridium botulinum]|nr:aldo/keto reductase [Clostridium botulinum]